MRWGITFTLSVHYDSWFLLITSQDRVVEEDVLVNLKVKRDALVLYTPNGFDNSSLLRIMTFMLQLSRWVTDRSFTLMWERFKQLLPALRQEPTGSIKAGMSKTAWEIVYSKVPWIILWLDSHTTHVYNLQVLEDAQYHKVKFLNFVTHTTHVSQTLDSGINTSIKVCREYSNFYFDLHPFLFHSFHRMPVTG